MNIQTVTPARLDEMMDTMTLSEICEALKCNEDELVELLRRCEDGK